MYLPLENHNVYSNFAKVTSSLLCFQRNNHFINLSVLLLINMHNRLPYRCDVLQIKDGELDQEFVIQEVLKDLAEKSANAEIQKMKEAVKLCAGKSKL